MAFDGRVFPPLASSQWSSKEAALPMRQKRSVRLVQAESRRLYADVVPLLIGIEHAVTATSGSSVAVYASTRTISTYG